MRGIILAMLLCAAAWAEEPAYGQRLRDVLAAYATAGEPAPAALIAAVAQPPEGSLPSGSAASELLRQAQTCVENLASLPSVRGILPEARIAAWTDYCRAEAALAVSTSLKQFPGPKDILPEAIARREPLAALVLILRVERELSRWRQLEPHAAPTPLRAQAELRMRAIAVAADAASTHSAALERLETSIWDAYYAGAREDRPVTSDVALIAALSRVRLHPHEVALARIDSVLADPRNSIFDAQANAYRIDQARWTHLVETANQLVEAWDVAQDTHEALLMCLQTLPNAQPMRTQTTALGDQLAAVRIEIIAALTADDQSAINAQAGVLIELDAALGGLRDVAEGERDFSTRFAERRAAGAFADEASSQRLVAALTDWRQGMLDALVARQRAAVLQRQLAQRDAEDGFAALRAAYEAEQAADAAWTATWAGLAEPAASVAAPTPGEF